MKKATEFNFSSLYFSYLQEVLKFPEYTDSKLSVNYENSVVI